MSKRQPDLKENPNPDQFLKPDLKTLECRPKGDPVWVEITGLISDSIYIGKTDMVLDVKTNEDFNKLEYCMNQGLIFNIIIRNINEKDKKRSYTLSENFLEDWR